MSGYLVQLQQWWANVTTTELVWLAVGAIAQTMFMGRFIVQWIASERVKRSIVPETFWYFSLAGGSLLLAYAIYRLDPIFILGQATGLIIYIRNLQLIRNGKRAERDGQSPGAPAK
ncbi:MAG: lipid-A-disaccharide synthase N-terminal domain-containing protein [Hyphomicrobiaceae bacterium]